MQTGGFVSGIQAVSPQVGRDHLLDQRLQTEVVVCDTLRFMDSLKHRGLFNKRLIKGNKTVSSHVLKPLRVHFREEIAC